jgi:hypothetical protein
VSVPMTEPVSDGAVRGRKMTLSKKTSAICTRCCKASGEHGPYVLVGASIAGIYIQAYQRAFPADVAALVFTNSSNRIGFKVKDKVGLIWGLTEAEIRSGYSLPPSYTKGPAPTREGDPFDKLPADLLKVRLWLDVRRWEESDPSTRQSPRTSCLGERNF